MNRSRMVVAMLLGLATVPPCAQAQETKPANGAERPVVRVVYFIPTDRRPEPDYRARLERVLLHVQQFYRDGMEQNGYGKLTFELDREPSGALRIYEVQAQGAMRDYGRNDSPRVRLEVGVALAKQNIRVDRETLIIFQLLLEWQGDQATELGPYVGGGGPGGGAAFVYDDAKLDTRLLESRERGGYYHRPCSLGEFNTHYIGGVAHELGHAFGLPHDCESDEERPRRGRSLMGGGNHTYGQELRGEGRGAFLSAASALPLSVHPRFTGPRADSAAMTCRLAELDAVHEGRQLVLSGRLEGGPRAVGITAHNDSLAVAADYDAVGWTCPVDAEGRFRLRIGELKPGNYALRLAAYGDSGNRRTFAFQYRVDDMGRPDLRPIFEVVWLNEALAAFRSGNKERLGTIAAEIHAAPPDGGNIAQKVDHLANLLAPPEPSVLADITSAEAPAADLKFDAASVGWGKALRNQVPLEGDATCLLTVGGKFFESGLYAHAPARHVLPLDGRWARFTTQYGLQDGHDGSVVFVVKGDDRELFRSPVVRDHQVHELTIEVAQVGKLELVVENAGDGNRADWGVWLAPRLRR